MEAVSPEVASVTEVSAIGEPVVAVAVEAAVEAGVEAAVEAAVAEAELADADETVCAESVVVGLSGVFPPVPLPGWIVVNEQALDEISMQTHSIPAKRAFDKHAHTDFRFKEHDLSS